MRGVVNRFAVVASRTNHLGIAHCGRSRILNRNLCTASSTPTTSDNDTNNDGDDEGVIVPKEIYPGEGQPKEYSPKIQAIVDDIAELNLLEVSELCDLLTDKFNIPDIAFAAAGAGAGGDGGGEAVEEKKEEQTEFAVKLKAFDAKAKIKLIKEVRQICSLGLKEAKEMVESAPVVLKKDLSKEEAEQMQETLKGLGAETELE